MNERIKLLAEQAGIEFTYDPTETPMRAFVECWEDEMAKFAELIVRECAKIAHECGPTVVNGSERQFDPVTYTAIQILEHFGVEE
jgi:hypothetical protein